MANTRVAFIDVDELVKTAEAGMDEFQNSEDPKVRERGIHSAHHCLFLWMEPHEFIAEAEASRLRYIGLTVSPPHIEDREVGQRHFEYVYGN